MWQTVKNRVREMIATAVALAFFLATFLLHTSTLQDVQGTRTFYLYSPSSQAKIQTTLSLLDVFYVEGESVFIACENTFNAYLLYPFTLCTWPSAER